MKNLRQEILHDIEDFIAKHPPMKSQNFGELAVANAKLVLRISRGQASLATLEKIYKFMATYKKTK